MFDLEQYTHECEQTGNGVVEIYHAQFPMVTLAAWEHALLPLLMKDKI
jgi:hypothetical protein